MALALVLGVVVAVAGATAALGLIGLGTFGPDNKSLSEADVRRSLSGHRAASSQAPAPRTSRSRSPRPQGSPGGRQSPVTGAFSTSGGSVFASCTSGLATLTRWIPAGGYTTDGVVRGPASSVWVNFKSAGNEVLMTVTCVGGRPHLASSADLRHGGEGGGGGSTGGGGH